MSKMKKKIHQQGEGVGISDNLLSVLPRIGQTVTDTGANQYQLATAADKHQQIRARVRQFVLDPFSAHFSTDSSKCGFIHAQFENIFNAWTGLCASNVLGKCLQRHICTLCSNVESIWP